MSPHKGWHSRGYLPHFDSAETIQLITFRQADSLPEHQVQIWNALVSKRNALPQSERRRLVKLLDTYLDAGHGSAVFREDFPADLMQNALLHFDAKRYHLHAWVVMPNHVHVLVELNCGYGLSKITHSWKSFVGHELKEWTLGPLWQEDYYDRFIRNEEHYHRAVEYIECNPVSAGLCKTPGDWRFSSARFRGQS